jgi:hypothetical protein
LCLEYCVVEFGAGVVGVPLVSWHVTPRNSGLLSNIPATPNALRYKCDPVQTEHKSINTCMYQLFAGFVCSTSYCSVK